jgi:hypothetical protein
MVSAAALGGWFRCVGCGKHEILEEGMGTWRDWRLLFISGATNRCPSKYITHAVLSSSHPGMKEGIGEPPT